jgi:hypothetical protein
VSLNYDRIMLLRSKGLRLTSEQEDFLRDFHDITYAACECGHIGYWHPDSGPCRSACRCQGFRARSNS